MLLAPTVLVGRLLELLVRHRQRRVRFGFHLLEKHIELRLRNPLAAVLALPQLTEQQLQLLIARDQLREERDYFRVMALGEERAQHFEHRAAQLLFPVGAVSARHGRYFDP